MSASGAWLLLCAGFAGMLWECLRPRLILPGTLGLGAALAGAYLLAPDAPILLTVLGTLLFAGLAYLLRRGRRNKAVD